MARVHGGRIPEDWITKHRLNLKSKINLDPILESDFAWFETENGDRIVSSRARVARSGVLGSKERTSGEDVARYQEEFESLWQDYPRRLGKKEALRHFVASRKAGHAAEAIRQAQTNYIAHIARDGIQMKFVQHGGTWFNNWQDWSGDGQPRETTGRPGFTV